MKIAVIGSGNIGGTLGAKWAAAGHEVVFGVRDPNSSKARAALVKAGDEARLETISAAIAFGDLVVLTIPSVAMQEVLDQYGAALDGKIVVDTTNKFGSPVVNSIAEILAVAPRATVFRAFNSLGWENFAEPVIGGVQVDLFYCGPDGEKRPDMETLIADVGLRPIYVGDLDQVAVVDTLGTLWATLVFRRGMGRRLAFKTLTP